MGAELAACRQAVGIAARLAAVVLELRGDPRGAEPLGEAVALAGGPERTLVVADPRRDRTVIARLREGGAPDVSDSHDVLVLVGPRAAAVLAEAELEVEGEPAHAVREVADLVLAGSPALVLRAEPERFLLLTDPAHSVAIWHALNDAGRDHGIVSVGRQALELLEAGERGAFKAPR